MKSKLSRRWRLFGGGILAAASLLAGCADSPTAPLAPRPKTITLSPASAAAASLGQEIQFSARVTDAGGEPFSGLQLDWTSSDTSVMVSLGNGLFRVKANGNASALAALNSADPQIGASGYSSGKLPDQAAAVVIHQKPAKIELSADTVNLYAVGAVSTLHATVLDELGSPVVVGPPPIWTAANPAVATVDSLGKLTAKADGQILINVQSSDITKSLLTRVLTTVPLSGCVTSAETMATVGAAGSCGRIVLTVLSGG